VVVSCRDTFALAGASGPLRRNEEVGRVEKKRELCLAKPCALSNKAGIHLQEKGGRHVLSVCCLLYARIDVPCDLTFQTNYVPSSKEKLREPHLVHV
jgi:hypothetical protein